MLEEQALPKPVARNELDVPFRIRVSLKRYFADERAQCYLMVSSGNSVRWLEARLRQEFALPGALFLLSAGYLLPRSETLALLRPDDPVDVIPVASSENKLEAHSGKPKERPFAPPTVTVPSTAVSSRVVADEALLLRRSLSAIDTTNRSDDAEDEEADMVADANTDALRQSKRHALSLLERLETGEPRRRRRRVHCRRRRPAFEPVPEPEPEMAPAAGDVLRVPGAGPGAGAQARVPRRVVPLDDA